MTHEEHRLWLIERLKADNPIYRKVPVPKDEKEQKDLLRMLMNVSTSVPGESRFLEIQDAYLRRENLLKGIVDPRTVPVCVNDSRLAIWQGDITRLSADAITNAANSGMTGCYIPLHNCIDNCIHSAAGLELRQYCMDMMRRQGHEEPVGRAKITPGFNLPAKYVLHTVGPTVELGILKEEHREQLRSSYVSCLELASANDLESVAFCCISTGVFMFPAEEAVKIAVSSVRNYLDAHPGISIKKIIFNVFSERDRRLYDAFLKGI